MFRPACTTRQTIFWSSFAGRAADRPRRAYGLRLAWVAVLSMATLAGCGDSAELSLLRKEAITKYVPPGAAVSQDDTMEAADSFGYGEAGVLRGFDLSGHAAGNAAYDAFVKKAESLGWKFRKETLSEHVKFGEQYFLRKTSALKTIEPGRRAMFVLDLSYYDDTEKAQISPMSRMFLGFNMGLYLPEDEIEDRWFVCMDNARGDREGSLPEKLSEPCDAARRSEERALDAERAR